MTLDQDEILNQQSRLQAHRQTLAILLRQQALLGEAYVPPAIPNGIHDARESIKQIKEVLQANNVVENHPDDEAQLLPGEPFISMIHASNERSVETSKFLEEFKLQAQEKVRRESKLYDKQSEAFKRLLTIVYRLRNSVRGLLNIENISEDSVQEYEDYYREFTNILFNERALLPDNIFELTHGIKTTHTPAIGNSELMIKRKKRGDDFTSTVRHIEHHFKNLDDIYSRLTILIQERLGIS